MKVIICGGRDYSDYATLSVYLDSCHKWWKFKLVITGGARGADTLAHTWATRRQIPTKVMPADWDTYGRQAGPIRNSEMLWENPDLVIAFKGGAGTEHMIKISRQANVPVFIL